MATTLQPVESGSKSANPLRLKRIHHIEFWVGNAKQAAFYYRKAFGFSQTAYRGLETGVRDQASYLMEQNKVRFVLTTPLSSASTMMPHLAKHGDGVRDIAFEVDDADAAFHEAVRRGAVAAVEPHTIEDANGKVRHAAIHTYGDTLHSFLTVKDYRGPFLPGFQEANIPGDSCGILRVDHCVGNVELGAMNQWAEFYAQVLGFARYITFDDKDISTEYSALMSIVMSDDSHSIKFPLNEPAAGKKKSQIEEYLDFYEGPGVQHIALQTTDIIETVAKLKANGVEFLRVPESYYKNLGDRVGTIDEPMAAIMDLGILVDRDEEGYLLQIFSKPVEDRPTVFFEIIQRHGSRGFGKGNFRALFEAIEQEQAKRGNL
ncbi:MAG: 4-hydroxyphenylpyruvate dioxygenase [Bryobacteraceae bacterium]